MNPEPKNQLFTTEAESTEEYDVFGSSHNQRSRFAFSFKSTSATQLGCSYALVLGSVASAGCIVSGAVIYGKHGSVQLISPALANSTTEIILLAINVVLTFCTDGMNFIHATSLRWALYRENRLDFNTNIRLFTSARHSPPNRWYTNVLALASLILCYASTSQLLFLASCSESLGSSGAVCTGINATALITLGLGLSIQAAIGIWCLHSTSQYIHTWSSNPLAAGMAMIDRYIHHREGRCMLAVQQSTHPSEPTTPRSKQSSLFRTKPAVGRVVLLVWFLALLLCIWFIITVAVTRKVAPSAWFFTLAWSARNPNKYDTAPNVLSLYINPAENSYSYRLEFSVAIQFVLAIGFVCVIQGLQTIGLHCVELLVNMSRDEAAWRAASITQTCHSRRKSSGASLSQSAFAAAVFSWENAILFSLKAALHWLIGQSMKMVFTNGSDGIDGVGVNIEFNYRNMVRFDMLYSRLLVSSGVGIFFALFATYLANRSPKGPQPAAWGHLQTLADLVDNWETTDSGRLWWGDKGEARDGVRHAGTSANISDLGTIHMNALYAG